jgi:hypothetical protein
MFANTQHALRVWVGHAKNPAQRGQHPICAGFSTRSEHAYLAGSLLTGVIWHRNLCLSRGYEYLRILYEYLWFTLAGGMYYSTLYIWGYIGTPRYFTGT